MKIDHLSGRFHCCLMRLPVLLIMSSGAFAQAVQLLAYPLIARLYSPENFGLFFGIISIIVILVTIFTMQLEAAILAARRSHIPLLACTASWLLCLSGAVCAVIIFFVREAFLNRELLGELGYAIWYLPVGMVIHGYYAIAVAMTVRVKGYSRLALAQLVTSLGAVAGQSVAGYLSFGVVGLVVSDGVSRFLGLVVLNKNFDIFRVVCVRVRGVIRVLARYRRFPLLMGPAASLNVISQNLQSICFPFIYGAQQAGQLGLAHKLIAAPAGLATGAINQVFTGEFSASSSSSEKQRKIVLDTLYLSTALALPLLACMVFGAEMILPLILGERWEQAGTYAAILSFGLAASMIVSPIGNVVVIKNSLTFAFCFSLAEVLLRALPFVIAMGVPGFSSVFAVVFISANNVLLYGVGLIRMTRLAGVSVSDYFKVVWRLLIFGGICFFPLLMIFIWVSNPYLLMGMMFFGVLVYLIVVMRKYQRI